MKFQLGEYTTTVSFVSLSDAIPRLADLVLFDENTRPLFPAFGNRQNPTELVHIASDQEVASGHSSVALSQRTASGQQDDSSPLAAASGSQDDSDPTPAVLGQQVAHIIPSGESEKCIERVLALVEKGLDLGLARDSLFVGCGGGVVCDMTAFAASMYMRGAKLILVPTTLLAMVDASLGGKGGVDFHGGKNLLGAFYPATEIRIAVDTLQTLSDFELLNGLAEVIKHALLRDVELLRLLQTHKDKILARDSAMLKEVITRAIEVKGWYIQEDFREQSVRAHLNLGHTFGHALESMGGLSEWSHGEAVAWGMMRALEAGALLGRTDKAYVDMVRELLTNYGYPIDHTVQDTDTFLQHLKQDKKKKGGEILFVLQEQQGKTFQQPLSHDMITSVIGGSCV